MAGYSVQIKRSAIKELEGITGRNDRRRVVGRIQALSASPRPAGCEKLSGHPDRYRVRQGDYRIVYAVDDLARVVLVVKVGHRREVYS